MLKSFLATTAIAFSLSLVPVVAYADDHSPAEMEMSGTEMADMEMPEAISPEKLALIQELRVLTKRDENATQVLDIMMNQIREQASAMSQGLFGDDPDPAMTAVFDETFGRIVDRMYNLMQAEIDFVGVQAEIDMKLYDEYFTTQELADLIAFYKTPTGQKTAETYPQLTQRSMELFNAEITPTMIEIQQQILMEELGAGFGMIDGSGEMEAESEEPMFDESEAGMM